MEKIGEEEKEESKEKKEYVQQDLFKVVERKTENREVGWITAEMDLRLMLLRHWSLQESIDNTNYLIAQLNLAKDHGKQRYAELLLSIGVPLAEAK